MFMPVAQTTSLQVTVSPTREGDIKLMWPAHDEPCFYRVVSLDGDYPPISPDEAVHHIATLRTLADDVIERQHAIRHYQVWRHDGPSVEAAKLMQPVLHAKFSSPTPVRNVTVLEDAGNIIGQWQTMPGTERVHVYRVPKSVPMLGVGDPRFRILESQPNLGGFVDTEAERGVSYRYHFVAEVLIDGVPVLSSPHSTEITPSINLVPVTDLSFQLHDHAGGAYFDLTWTLPPGGETVIFRTVNPPAAGIDRGVIPVEALEQAGLGEEHRLVHPIATAESTALMNGVSWPDDWTRAYFTPVVVHDGQALVGKTVTGVRVGPAKHPTLADRVHRQVLSFGWPLGATSVQIYQTAPGAEAHTAYQAGPVQVVDSHENYREGGGVSFPRGQLAVTPAGCDLHVLGVAYEGAAPHFSAPVSVRYTPVVPLQYQVKTSYSLMRKPNGAVIEIVSPEIDIPITLHVVLVSNPYSLPLTPEDGTHVPLQLNIDAPLEAQNAFPVGPISRGSEVPISLKAEPQEFQRITDGKGYLRLFVLQQPEGARIALLDPPVRSLMLKTGLPWNG